MLVFSSDWLDLLFLPFVKHYLVSGTNPWDSYRTSLDMAAFPYPPGMLLIHAFPLWFVKLFVSEPPDWLFRLAFKVPSLLADLSICLMLMRLYSSRKNLILWVYFASPILLYAVYMHSQLDLVPTAFLFFSALQLMKRQIVLAALGFSLALLCKTHVLALLPLILIWLWKKNLYWEMGLMLTLPLLIFYIGILPFGSEAFYKTVFASPEQSLLFAFYLPVGNRTVFVAPMVCLVIYLRFLAYEKINRDLFFSFAGLLFSVFVLCVPPMPGWYVWSLPFVSVFFVQILYEKPGRVFLYLTLVFSYLLYFVLCHPFTVSPLNFLGTQLPSILNQGIFTDLGFTLLWTSLVLVILAHYGLGVRSNLVYRRRSLGVAIGIGGDSAVGKSTLLKDLKSLFGLRLLDLEGDADHRWDRAHDSWNSMTHLNPRANHLHRQMEDILSLKRGRAIHRNDYDHLEGKLTESRKVEAAEYIVLSGLHPFYLPKMRKILDLKIYLDTEESLRRHWKILRDTLKRGYSETKVLTQIQAREEDALKYIKPQKNYADLIISYFPCEDGENQEKFSNLGLKLGFGASVNTEILRQCLQEQGLAYSWDYSSDLQNQEFIFYAQMNRVQLMAIAGMLILNLEDMLEDKVQFEEGHRGMVQLILLFLMSEKTKGILSGEDELVSL
ncbi:MAG: hypothetical protein H3C47_01260 [Candidatus Cloacimonetes bacterium]|nr:hypothetical protein [Candidatus Cloacimonadota bacterium]